MKNNLELLAIARKYIGTTGNQARSYCGLPKGSAWCCAFVTWVFHLGDDSKLWYGGKKAINCPSAMAWCRANLAEIPIYLALPMDVIFFDWNHNGSADHVGFVKQRVSDQQVDTLEGNTSGGKVAYKTRPVKYVAGCFRPNFAPTSYKIAKLEIDGHMGYSTIACLQKALGVKVDGILGKQTVKALQKKAGVTQDGSWGKKTSKAVQKMVGAKQDGWFGNDSVKCLQKWINNKLFPATTAAKAPTASKPAATTKTIQDKVADKAKALIKGKFKYVFYKKNKNYPVNGGNCIRFVACCLSGGGIKVSTKQDGLLNDAFGTKLLANAPSKAIALWKTRNGSGWGIIKNANKKIPESKLKKGDVLLCYDGKTYKHTALYMGDGMIADCTSSRNATIRKYSSLGYPCKLAFRYTGK